MMARALVFYLIAVGVLVCTLAHFAPRKPPTKNFAYCYTNRFGLAYPCHENPHWREDI